MSELSGSISIIGLDLSLPGCPDVKAFHQRIYDTNYTGMFTRSEFTRPENGAEWIASDELQKSIANVQRQAELSASDTRKTSFIEIEQSHANTTFNTSIEDGLLGLSPTPLAKKADTLHQALILSDTLLGTNGIQYCIISVSRKSGVATLLLTNKQSKKESAMTFAEVAYLNVTILIY